jgi:hypothetical protein
MSDIYSFVEGTTDQVVFDVLTKALKEIHNLTFGVKRVNVKGKDNFRGEILVKLEPELNPGEPERYVRILAFRDLDADEERQDVVASFESLARKLLARWQLEPQFSPLDAWPNIFTMDKAPTRDRPGLRFVLHIADPPHLEKLNLKNITTDCYVLAVALREPVLGRFAQQADSQSDTLHTLITREVPRTIMDRKIAFDEDKDFLAAYLCAARFWTVRRTEEKERLLNIVLDRALKHGPNDFWSIFASWKAAIEETVR